MKCVGGHWRLYVDRIAALPDCSLAISARSDVFAWAVGVVMLLVGGLPVSELLQLETDLWTACAPGYRERMDPQNCILLDV